MIAVGALAHCKSRNLSKGGSGVRVVAEKEELVVVVVIVVVIWRGGGGE